ncbi:GNAT family N-acetyltransferase [Duganella sp. BuS-21]|uniref:GNAT family N-acetyltransferase n=1 Tax=Duganella sp. BuS-21 TaxID=2943848 RepID=UPI0035A6FAC1
MTATSSITVRRVSAEEALHDATRGEPLAAALTDILINCVEGGASVSFMLPLPRTHALAFWRGALEGAARGERVLLVAETGDGRIVGTVQLVTAQPDNQPHRADVAKMLVHRDARRQGVAAQLLTAVDQAARAEKKTVLVLDTVTGSDAERLYQRAGWQLVGVVPNFALMPDGAYCGTTFFHKQLPV